MPGRIVAVGGALKAALVTAPGRPQDRPPVNPGRAAFWRSAVIVQAVLAVALLAIGVYGPPWPAQMTIVLLAVSLPLSLLGADRPLSAWRVGMGAMALSAMNQGGWMPAPLAACVLLAPAAYLYLVGLAYDRLVLLGAWFATTALAAIAATALATSQPYFAWAYPVVGANGGTLAMVELLLPTVAALLAHNTRGRRLAGRALVEQRLAAAREQSARAVLEERYRIARELHDVVAHHMSVIAIHAETAPYRVTEPPAPLVESFSVIRTSALQALTEMRRLLTLLRAQDGTAETAPQPGLVQVDDLVATARGGGLAVEFRVLGAPRPLPPGVDLSAYRIVQEGLSNALRHAAGATVRVDIEYASEALRLTIRNDRPSGPPAARGPEPGHGLLGMRERTMMFGGAFRAAPTPDGGFLVTASLPLEPDVSQAAS